jgi:hypothetical protein
MKVSLRMDDEKSAGSVPAPSRRPTADLMSARRDSHPPAARAAERLAAMRSGAVTAVVAAALVAFGAAMPWSVGVLIFHGPTGWESAVARWALLFAVAVTAVTAVVFGASLVWFRRFNGTQAQAAAAPGDSWRHPAADNLDAQASVLLRRTQDAIDAVKASEVCRVDLLDQAAHDTALAAQEWEIVLALREQSRLRQARVELPAIADDSPARELLDRMDHTAQLADQSIDSRVAALERLAAEIHRADKAYRDWRDQTAISELVGEHVDMLARTAADSHAVAQLDAMSQEARVVRLTLEDKRLG